ncbi:MAG: diguanylate cyclase [Candidatus Eremiobacteraeota bacterium]|nr:diguanylate cyclase [Candidatus Eremiobacteraeota bacterium]
MKVLLWTHNSALDTRVSSLVSATGAILFRPQSPDEIASLARREQPLLILLAPGEAQSELQAAVEELASHPDTRWTPIVLVADAGESKTPFSSLLDRGAASVIDLSAEEKLLQAQFRALHRSTLRLSTLRSTRLTDEKTGFYHQNFLLDQLQVLCRKKRRDGISFCILFLELKGAEDEVHKAALGLSNTVRGADLFGRWESELFAVLLPSSQPSQAHLLAKRCKRILEEAQVSARASLVSSDSEAVEAEALVEAAMNTLDEAWNGDSFLWAWNGSKQQAEPVEVTD